MYKKEMRRAAALLAVCWLGLLFRAAAETPAEDVYKRQISVCRCVGRVF